MKNFVAAVVCVAGMSAGSAMAAGYGMAGCGLGSLVFGNDKGMMQVLAATTNGTFGSQTFGITSGTSNCKDAAPAKEKAEVIEQRDFVANNMNDLRKEAAQGQGETLKAFAGVLGCDSASYGNFANLVQKNYQKVFVSGDAAQVLDSAKASVRSDASLNRSCPLAG